MRNVRSEMRSARSLSLSNSDSRSTHACHIHLDRRVWVPPLDEELVVHLMYAVR